MLIQLATIVAFSLALSATVYHIFMRKQAKAKLMQLEIDEGKLLAEDLDPEIKRVKDVVERELKKANLK